MSDSSRAHPADRLLAAIERKGAPVCVGIDPVVERFPDSIRPSTTDHEPTCAAAIAQFCGQVLRAVSPHVPCVKFQSACFERHRIPGLHALRSSIVLAKHLGLEIILDAKRGDIGTTAEHYAAAAFEPLWTDAPDMVPDWITINSYLGDDGIMPFLQRPGCGAFALVRTSNPGGDAIQNLRLQDGRTLAHAVAELVAEVGRGHIGGCGFSSLGAVVGATKKQDAARLRELMPQQIFLVPGFGAQGGGVEDVLPCFDSNGTGAIVTASRSVNYAFAPGDPRWTESVGDAAAGFARQIAQAVGRP